MLRIALAITASIFALTVDAEIYKWTDGDGKVHYGDTPTQGAKASRVEVTPTPSDSDIPATGSGEYSMALHECLANGGAKDECVNKASAAQFEKSKREREQAEREKADSAKAHAQHATIITPTTNSAKKDNDGVEILRPDGYDDTPKTPAQLSRAKKEKRQRDELYKENHI